MREKVHIWLRVRHHEDRRAIRSGNRYKTRMKSLVKHSTPQWFRDAKFGMYARRGLYSVPAGDRTGPGTPTTCTSRAPPSGNTTSAPMADPEDFEVEEFIPMFKGERFKNTDEWAEFPGNRAHSSRRVGEHHDGFTMWNTRLNDWNAMGLGPGPTWSVTSARHPAAGGSVPRGPAPRRTASFYPHWRKEFDTSDPRYAGLYGEPHNLEGGVNNKESSKRVPSGRFIETWKAKILEVIDAYDPDMLWFDYGLRGIPEKPKEKFLAYYCAAVRRLRQGSRGHLQADTVCPGRRRGV